MMKMRKKIKIEKTKQEVIDRWIQKHGAATFDLKGKNIILHDGGLFSVEKEIKIKPKTRVIFGRLHKADINGKTIKTREIKFIPLKRNGRIIKEEVEYYKAYIWIKELDDAINYFKSMKRMLNKLGFATNHKKIAGRR